MTAIVCMCCTLQKHMFDTCVLSLFKDLYLLFSVVCVGMCACVCVCISACACRGQRSPIHGALELAFRQLWAFRCGVGGLWTEFWSSKRAECSLNHWVVSSHLALLLFKENISDSYRQAFCTISNLFIIVAYFFPGWFDFLRCIKISSQDPAHRFPMQLFVSHHWI